MILVNNNKKLVPEWYAWKPVVIKQSLQTFHYILWVDTGTTVLKQLDNLFKYIQNEGYFLATIGNEIINGRYKHPLSWATTSYIQKQIMAGVIGISKKNQNAFLNQLYKLTYDLKNFCV